MRFRSMDDLREMEGPRECEATLGRGNEGRSVPAPPPSPFHVRPHRVDTETDGHREDDKAVHL